MPSDSRKPVVLLSLCALIGLIAGCPSQGIDPEQFTSSDSLQSVNLVQQAVATLAANGHPFAFFSGSAPVNLAGVWDINSSTLLFTDAGATNSSLPPGRMSFAAQQGSPNLVWSTTQGGTSGASRKSFYDGTSNGVTASLFAEIATLNTITGQVTCSTQSAVFFSFLPGTSGDTLTGTFLSVVLGPLAGGSPCGAAGSFRFGTINLTRINPDIPVIKSLGTVPLGIGTPTNVVVAPGGGFGYVAFGTGAVLRFDTASRTSAFLSLPTPNNFTSVGPLGIAPAGGAIGFAMQGDNRLLSFNTSGTTVLEAQFAPPQTPSPATFLPLAPLYNAVATAGYAGLSFQNQRPALAVFNPHAGTTIGSITSTVPFTQDGLGLMRINANTTQVAAILKGGAPGNQARFIGLVNVNSQTPTLTREVDVSSPTFGNFRDDQLVYGADGNRVFVTNGQSAISVGANGGFAVNSVDPRQDAADVVRHMAVSDDNEVLAITIAASGTRSNWVLVSPNTLAEFHRATEQGAAVRASGGNLMMVPGTRIAVVEDGVGSVTPIHTRTPFAAGQALSATASAATADIAASAVGGRVIAVVNRAERTLYLFELTNP